MTAGNAIAIVNAGSSSIKFSLFGEEGTDLQLLLKGQIEGLTTEAVHFVVHDAAGACVAEEHWNHATFGHDEGMRHLLAYLSTHLGGRHVDAVGHRIVHGGLTFTAPVRLDANVVSQLERLIPLAPLHQPHHLAPIQAVLGAAP